MMSLSSYFNLWKCKANNKVINSPSSVRMKRKQEMMMVR